MLPKDFFPLDSEIHKNCSNGLAVTHNLKQVPAANQSGRISS
jgi:hypothetical protein